MFLFLPLDSSCSFASSSSGVSSSFSPVHFSTNVFFFFFAFLFGPKVSCSALLLLWLMQVFIERAQENCVLERVHHSTLGMLSCCCCCCWHCVVLSWFRFFFGAQNVNKKIVYDFSISPINGVIPKCSVRARWELWLKKATGSRGDASIELPPRPPVRSPLRSRHYLEPAHSTASNAVNLPPPRLPSSRLPSSLLPST